MTLALLLVFRASAGEALDGPTFGEIASQTANVMALHLDFLDAQSDYDLSAPYAIVDAKSASTPILLGDGTQFDGGVLHEVAGIGLGWGHPRTGVAIFGGAQIDRLDAGRFPTGVPSAGFQAERTDALFYGGLGFRGIQASYGYRRTTDLTGVDDTGRFVADGRDEHGTPSSAWMLTVHQRAGLSAGALFADVIPETGSMTAQEAKKRVLASLQTHFEPKHLLDDALGRLGVGVDRLAPEVDYYREESPDRPRPEDTKPSWEIPLGGREIAGGPFDLRLVTEVRPTTRLRTFETGLHLTLERMTFGARLVETNRNQHFEPSVDLYWQGQRVFFYRKYFSAFSMAVSYSYNSPDPSMFLPFTRSHIIGIQLSGGIPGIHPIIPALTGWRSPQFSDWDEGVYYDYPVWRGEDAPLGAPEDATQPPADATPAPAPAPGPAPDGAPPADGTPPADGGAPAAPATPAPESPPVTPAPPGEPTPP